MTSKIEQLREEMDIEGVDPEKPVTRSELSWRIKKLLDAMIEDAAISAAIAMPADLPTLDEE